MASKLTSGVQVVGQDMLTTSSTQVHALGEMVMTPDGRIFRYCKAGGTTLVPGKLQQAPAEVTTHQGLTPSAAAIGDTSITVTLGATNAATANQYADGLAIITVTPGQGYTYKIKSHPAIAASAAGTIQLDDPIQVALTTSSRVDLVLNPYNGVIVNPTAATSGPIGVAIDSVTNAEFGWLQTHGPIALLADGAVTVGVNVSASNATAGAVEAAVTAQAAVGFAMTGIATTEYGSVFLTLD